MFGTRPFALIWTLLVVVHARSISEVTPAITMNFMECATSSHDASPTRIMTCTASVTVSELPAGGYYVEYTNGDDENSTSFQPTQLTTFTTWQAPGIFTKGSAYAWFKASDGGIVRSSLIPISAFSSPPPPRPSPPPPSPLPPIPSPPPPEPIVFDSVLCQAYFNQRIACNVTMTFEVTPDTVWLTFAMVDGSKAQQKQFTNSKHMIYTTIFSGTDPAGTVTATVVTHGVPVTVGPYTVTVLTSIPPPPPPTPPSPSPSPAPTPVDVTLSNAWCTQQESDLYKCQVEVATSSLLALITVTYDVGGVSATHSYAPRDLNTISTITVTTSSMEGTSATSRPGSLPVPPLPFTYSTPHPIKCAATNSYPLSTGRSPTKSCSFSTRYFPTLSRAGALARSSSLPCSSLPISTVPTTTISITPHSIGSAPSSTHQALSPSANQALSSTSIEVPSSPSKEVPSSPSIEVPSSTSKEVPSSPPKEIFSASSQESLPASSQEGVPASSQEGVPASSQEGLPASSQEGLPASSQEGVPASSQEGLPASSQEGVTRPTLKALLSPPPRKLTPPQKHM
ncbi:hypothetical protein ACKKBF_B04590 [Auxenochlorella protothecoides x Auxenochlorella symbiontica]